jgi:hypothetical protein
MRRAVETRRVENGYEEMSHERASKIARNMTLDIVRRFYRGNRSYNDKIGRGKNICPQAKDNLPGPRPSEGPVRGPIGSILSLRTAWYDCIPWDLLKAFCWP